MRCRASSAGDGGNARASAEFRAFPVRVTGRMTLARAAAMPGVSPRTFIRRIQWCDTGSRAAYTRLFPRPPAPRALAADGGAGCAAAAADTWKDTRIQRRLVHVPRNTRTDLTCRPRTDAGKDLPGLARKPVKVRDADAAAAWLNLPDDWHTRYADVIGQRTTARDDPATPKPAPAGSVPSTTNRLEGGVNADIKRVLDAHRGLTEEHMKRCEWVLYMKTHNPDPGSFITAAHDETTEPPTTSTGLPAGSIQEAAPGVDAYESGFGIRKGWAGKTR